jgi:prevent-host-death family protein
MKTVAAAEFKARCLKIMDDVQSTREPVLVTKNGRPVAKVVPVSDVSDDFLGRLSGTMKIVGDITQPIEPPDSWDALK